MVCCTSISEYDFPTTNIFRKQCLQFKQKTPTQSLIIHTLNISLNLHFLSLFFTNLFQIWKQRTNQILEMVNLFMTGYVPL